MDRNSIIVLLVALLVASASATKGNRQGCLEIRNKSTQEIIVYLKGSNHDGSWHVPAGVRNMLVTDPDEPDATNKIIVDEETIVWGKTVTAQYPKISLLKDPTATYVLMGREGCHGGGWIKPFR